MRKLTVVLSLVLVLATMIFPVPLTAWTWDVYCSGTGGASGSCSGGGGNDSYAWDGNSNAFAHTWAYLDCPVPIHYESGNYANSGYADSWTEVYVNYQLVAYATIQTETNGAISGGSVGVNVNALLYYGCNYWDVGRSNTP